ncbi:MAG: restriction endonuclease subunit S, partial [Blastocatellia bacterium]
MDWEEKELESVCELIADCPHSTPEWTDDGVFVIRSWNVRDGKLNFDKPSYTSEETYLERIRRATPSEGDIVITREAPMGEVC